jgi:hypothetical protein
MNKRTGKLDMYECVEPVLFLRRRLKPNLKLSDMRYFILLVAHQCDKRENHIKDYEKILDIIDNSINFN